MSNTDSGKLTKEYIRPIPSDWWLKKKTYFLFMVRELTSVFVGGYALFLLALASQLENPEAFASLLTSPILIALQIIAIPMIVYHTITWLNLTPKVLVIWRGEKRVSPLLIAAAHYLAWAVFSCAVLWIASFYR